MDLGGLWICPARSDAVTGSISHDASFSANHCDFRKHSPIDSQLPTNQNMIAE